MDIGFDAATLLTGALVFLARVADVSIGTMRTISIVRGRTKTAFLFGFVEVSLWLVVIAAVLDKIASKPILGILYALGFSTGNVFGILLERRIAFGNIVLRVISSQHGSEMARKIRAAGYAVTTILGEGMTGPVTLLYVVCRRKDLKSITAIIQEVEPDAFHITEMAGDVSRVYHPSLQVPTGWRAILKKR
ncbi:MAG: DUF2179 domain-containing protein [Acidobacteria bacterium]|nr:DUF2179 domain-containing protein [Acidobacteriota bacterium]